jgi:hypothetical protein
MHQFKLNSTIYRIILLNGHIIAFNLMKIPFYSRWAVIESKSVSIYFQTFFKNDPSNHAKSCTNMILSAELG